MTASMSTFGRSLLERIGRSRRFVFTLLRSSCKASISLVMSSGRVSSSEESNLRLGLELFVGDEHVEESESESWRVSSNTSSSSSESWRTGESRSSWMVGPFFSIALLRSIFGGRNRLVPAKGDGGGGVSSTMAKKRKRRDVCLQGPMLHHGSKAQTKPDVFTTFIIIIILTAD